MNYCVSIQNGYYDEGQPRVEIATSLDEMSPGALSGTIDEFDMAREAVEDALEKSCPGAPDTDPLPITISTAASIGLYPSPEDGRNREYLLAWAERRDEAAQATIDEEEDAWMN